MEKLPEKLFERDIESVNCGLSDLYFFSRDEIESGQAGYRINGITGEPIKEWIGENFYVIGTDSCCGDPIITDISKEELPIYYMFHDDWSSLQLIATSIDQFIEILHLIDKTNIKDEKEKGDLLGYIENIVPDEAYDYWQVLIQTGFEFLNHI